MDADSPNFDHHLQLITAMEKSWLDTEPFLADMDSEHREAVVDMVKKPIEAFIDGFTLAEVAYLSGDEEGIALALSLIAEMHKLWDRLNDVL